MYIFEELNLEPDPDFQLCVEWEHLWFTLRTGTKGSS
jgi:hypothetical protein